MRFHRVLAHSSCVVAAVFWSTHSGAEPARPLTLSQALQRAVAANPRLAVAEREIGVATGRRIKRGRFPIPKPPWKSGTSAAAVRTAARGLPRQHCRSAN